MFIIVIGFPKLGFVSLTKLKLITKLNVLLKCKLNDFKIKQSNILFVYLNVL